MKERRRPRPLDRDALERLYRAHNRRERIEGDPVLFVHGRDLPDREIAALVASSLAYGRVGQILASAGRVLERMPRPSAFLRQSSRGSLRRTLAGFRHRFTSGRDLAAMLLRAKGVLEEFGSLERCFVEGMRPGDETVVPALSVFAERIAGEGGGGFCLFPSPRRGSACKRPNLFLRWLVRADEVDPGGWTRVPAAKLVVPLDVHLHRFSRAIGFTSRRQADLRAAVEVTARFRRFAPRDPVRYDFALAHLGMSGGTACLWGGRGTR